MYYENKKVFYIKQYGPAAIIIVISLVLIFSGIYLSLNGNTIPKEEVAVIVPKPNPVITKPVENNASQITDFAETGKVTEINNLAVVIKAKSGTLEINLIGVKENRKYPNLSSKLKEELVGKDVKIAYDTEKVINNKIYGYVYLNDVLYNVQVLENGYAELKTERINVNKLDLLVAAQIKARKNYLGIWSDYHGYELNI